jgi:hypothetical protein
MHVDKFISNNTEGRPELSIVDDAYFTSLKSEQEWLQTLLILFALQHFVFIVDKLAYYLFISIFCLGCACVEGEVVPMPMIDGVAMSDYDPIGNRAVSFYYEKWIS